MNFIFLRLIAHKQHFTFSRLLSSKLRSSVYLFLLFVGSSLSNTDLANMGTALLECSPKAWLVFCVVCACNAALTVDVEASSPNICFFEASLPIPYIVTLIASSLTQLLIGIPILVTVILMILYAPAPIRGKVVGFLMMVVVCIATSHLIRRFLYGIRYLAVLSAKSRKRHPLKFQTSFLHVAIIRLRVLLRSYKASLSMDALILFSGFAIYLSLVARQGNGNVLKSIFLPLVLISASQLTKYVTYLKVVDQSLPAFLDVFPLSWARHRSLLIAACFPLLIPHILIFAYIAASPVLTLLSILLIGAFLILAAILNKNARVISFFCCVAFYILLPV